MKDNMKKIYLFLLAAAGILAVASCAREELLDKTGDVNAPGEVTTLTFSFDATKTALVDGKTTWAAGDKIRVFTHDGTFYRDVEVPEEAVGQSSFSAEVNIKDSVYLAVYPIEASKGIAGGKITVNLPKNPDGRFDSANICVAVARGTEFQMHNVTAVLKITVNSGNVVEMLQIIAKNAMVGDYAIGYGKKDGKDTLNFAASGTSKSITVPVGGIDGDYFIPVLPGTYEKGMSVTALRGNGGYQNDTTAKDNVVKINTLYNLGVIGDNLSDGLPGEGTAENPFTISNLGEMNAFATSVTMGKTYKDEIVSLEADITDAAVTAPAGYYQSADDQGYFAGTFKGNNHSIKLNIDGANCKTPNYVALFGLIDQGAVLDGIKVEGTVTTTGNYAAGLVAYVRGVSTNKVLVENCESSVSVTGANQVSGIAGYATYMDLTNCTNKGVLNGKTNVAGICGYAYQGNIIGCKNEGAITGTADCGRALHCANKSHAMTYLDGSSSVGYNTISTTAIGGISGFTQNVTVKECTNSGAITGISKVGGVVGTSYWSTTNTCVNTGAVTAEKDYVGGITGWAYTNSNNLTDTNSGNVKGRAAVGGIVGMSNAGISNGIMTVKDCKNTGTVTSDYTTAITGQFYTYGFGNLSAAGGIVGLVCEYTNGSGNRYTKLQNCVNDGDVVAKGEAAGGIIGMRACPLNNNQYGFVENCVNNGTVETKLYRAAGIVGIAFDRFENSGYEIRNCYNHGTVKGPYVLGGIVSWSSSAYPAGQVADAACIRVINCLNDGDVLYDKTAYADGKGPYCGGINGYNQKMRIYNCVNMGNVKPQSGEPNEYDVKYIGEVNACLGRYGKFNYVYAKESDMAINGPNHSGNTPIGVMGDVLGRVKADGSLSMPVTIKEVDYENAHEALNAWITEINTASVTYYKWKLGPEFDI